MGSRAYLGGARGLAAGSDARRPPAALAFAGLSASSARPAAPLAPAQPIDASVANRQRSNALKMVQEVPVIEVEHDFALCDGGERSTGLPRALARARAAPFEPAPAPRERTERRVPPRARKRGARVSPG